MKGRLLVYCALLALVFGCRTIYVPVDTNTHVEYRDSVIYKTDTLKIDVPVETIKEVVPALDTLRAETSVAKMVAYLDTTTVTLKGSLENKKTSLSDVRIVYKEKIQYRDSIQTKEVPVEVEKIKKVTPKWAWWSLIASIIMAFVIGGYAYLHLKP